MSKQTVMKVANRHLASFCMGFLLGAAFMASPALAVAFGAAAILYLSIGFWR